MPPRYLLQQWTDKTLKVEERDYDGHGAEVRATPSTKQRLLDLSEDDVVLIAAVRRGVLLPVSAVTVNRTATRDELIADGLADDELHDRPYFAVGKAPFRPMNLRRAADRALSQSIRKADGTPLARSSRDPRPSPARPSANLSGSTSGPPRRCSASSTACGRTRKTRA